jgi:hypothetical protein
MVSYEGLARRNTLVKYKSPTTYESKVIIKVKVLLTDGQTERQTDKVITIGHPP